MDGIIIVDDTGRPIVQTNFRNTPASYPLLHVDAFNDALAKARAEGSRPPRVDPVLSVQASAKSDRHTSVCCHVERAGLWFLCPVSADVDPLYVFAFLDTFIGILEEYLGDLSSSVLKDHFDVVYQLLEEMLDDGSPLTTESNTLRDIVLPPSLLNKIMSVAGVAGLSTPTPAPFSSPIPWRKAGLRYNNNEIYFDVIEKLDAIVLRNGTTLVADVSGKIKCNSRLSGTPDLLLSFASPQALADPSFHPCVRLGKYTTDKLLSFVPPDGHFTLMEYRVNTPTSLATSIASSAQIPILLKPSIQTAENGGTIDIIISSRLPSNRSIEGVSVTLFLGTATTSANCTISTSQGLGQGGVKMNSGEKEGSWSFEPKTQMLRWDIPLLTPTTRTLRGTFVSSDTHPRISRSIHASFVLPQNTISGLKVDQLKIVNEAYKPYKGVRTSAGGSIEWRL